ncbi:phenylalanine--tRNA ligase subunit alpha [candidate division WOR-1 bacterium RIFOXYB2_FULL_42_35]|uniref:Phenylalanine--tRNA ligase alpha subunit n=1 Tax=candidate division WOR-1 bacterium RIFOXYC2_FULL_41_25 TaxID=1802586 RepID=A0A1F4TNF6_UNCSA|nr:MAG: phenylalanine--tRNA ligase subunit alpha [candidate division WOR-1 bacterium RIFOXYA2_FULL_41_14]OGC23212.1 MAG: phenylalanine--tRNA ligase subunit alpha [candidate division WOR-1 bacterium RIFOXYB2_FULL_42_35]OGC34262.1 MAG: phenylalanine--tRNA ligase subunit alpha [candidate division WOR-1 bacterium RIFOXYC2_FULL_41_25]
MQERIKQIEAEAIKTISGCQSLQSLEEARIRYLGKNSDFFSVLRSLGTLTPEERPIIGALVNTTKANLEQAMRDKKVLLLQAEQKQRIEVEKIDVSLPGKGVRRGTIHPLSQVMKEAQDIFLRLGYEIAEGPEVETEYHNFDGLNIPPHHPSRDAWGTFFVKDEVVLRTHTSPVQIRVMEKRKPPLAIIAPGRVYRRDSDATHSPIFNQLEGFLVDQKITFGDLKGTLTEFLRQMFGKDKNVRFRPSFFPFTEPSAEVDVECVMCSGRGCRLCKGSGWLEILGSGMIDPNVFKAVGYDPKKFSGFAFGMGIERIAMLKYKIDDIRLFFENDVRFLEQF